MHSWQEEDIQRAVQESQLVTLKDVTRKPCLNPLAKARYLKTGGQESSQGV